MSEIAPFKFFLGGTDLEMVTIRKLLQAQGEDFEDAGLSWGAKASSYTAGIHIALSSGRKPVLVELTQDLPQSVSAQCLVIDHHGPMAGKSMPTALEQVFRLLQLPHERWSRHFDLVAANDRGHIRAMRELIPPASDAEVRAIREADLQSQGVKDEDIAAAKDATATATSSCDGRLTHIHSAARAGLIAEYMEPFFGGPDFHNLLVTGPTTIAFFGEGRCVYRLVELSPSAPSSWFGGALPGSGFWGAESSRLDFDPVAALESLLGSDSTGS